MFVPFFSYLAEHFDLPILEWIASHLRNVVFDTLMPYITMLGDGGVFWIVLAVLFLIFPKTRRMGLGMAIAMVLGLLVCNVTLKPWIARIRPYDYQMQEFGKYIQLMIAKPHDFSFPSGHTIASFEAATVILLNRKDWGIPAMILAVLIAFSRMYLYVHYPTDVLASIILGVLFALIGYALAKKILPRVPGTKGKYQR